MNEFTVPDPVMGFALIACDHNVTLPRKKKFNQPI
jgi:hypothetical protein